MTTIIHSARIVDGGLITDDGWIACAGARVAGRGVGDSWKPLAEAGADIIDAVAEAGDGAVLTPGFIDLHGHGGGGASYDDGADAIRTARRFHLAHGTTRAVVSLVTAALPDLEERVARIAELAGTDAGVLGSHLEGPFLDPGHRGAHDPALLRHPDPEALARLVDAGAGTVRQITLAPELPGGLDAVAAVTAAGVVAAVGHTDADADASRAAFDAGATLLTHAFNAMPPLHHRAPGPVGAGTADPRVTLEVIADGVHLHPDVIRIAFAAAPGRIALVTDAMAAAGMADGRYDLGGLAVDVTDSVARLVEGSAIAGSTLTQDAALRNAVAAGVPLEEAVLALTATPARVLGETRIGSLAPDVAADAVLLTADLDVRGVWFDGARVSPTPHR